MEITRFGERSNKINEDVKVIAIEIDGETYRLNERFGELQIHKSGGGTITVKPLCGNEITIK